ncbi:MAG: preprotein translocase subunit SecD, partial [Actinomycetota bacterium]|nr:preprotein translocase subunit SecD [Actinomycetota bacterium]
MARTPPVKKARRSLVWLGVIILALVGLNVFDFFTMSPPAHTAQSAIFAPKLGLDLVGGTEVILQPKVASGVQVTGAQLDQAVSIIRERIDAAGVSEPDISTDGTGGSEKVVVDIPGTLSKQTVSSITKAAQLSFRAVLLTSAATDSAVGPTATPTPGSTATPGATPTPTPSLRSTPTSVPTNGSDLAYVTPAVQATYDSFNCKSAAAANANLAPKNQPLVTCSSDGTTKFVLGPVELSGTSISTASSALVQTSTGASTGEWGVNIKFNSAGGAKFEAIGNRLVALATPRNQFAVVLDGQVITAPVVQQSSSSPQITGNFTQASATTLANQLKFGALPISFTILSSENISPTLGI